MAIVRNFVKYDLGLQNVAGFTAGSALIGGAFVYVNGADWTIKHAVNSATVKPIGAVSNDVASGATEIEVVTGGYVLMQTQVAMAAGDPVFPSSVKGRIIKTGKLISGTTTPVFAGGFGVVVAGASASGFALVKLQNLV